MITDQPPPTRSSRLAIMSSIQIRKASLQIQKSKLQNSQKSNNTLRNSSFGKIVKNISQISKDLNLQLLESSQKKKIPIFNSSSQNKKNILGEIQILSFNRKTPTPSFGQFDQYDNTRAKKIQEKYKAMLNEYDNKKKAIYCQLNALKTTSTQLNKNKDGAKQNYNNHLIAVNEKYQKYIPKSKQLYVQKLGGTTDLKHKKKDKACDNFPNFFKVLKNQIQLQQEYRNLRRCVIPQQKQEIYKIINQKQQLKGKITLELDAEQFDPFQFKTPSTHVVASLASKIIQKYKECEDNWTNKVCKLKLEQAKQIFEALNFQKTNEISIKSFVRELSYLLEKHLRNRDLFRIYNRICPFSEQHFCEILVHKQ